MGSEVSGERTSDLKSQGDHSTAGPEVFSRSAAEAWAVEARRLHGERISQLFSHTRVCFFLLLLHTLHPLVSVLSQGLDPPHQSETRTVYVANRFPQHGHYIPQRFADNRIISSKVLNVCRDIISLSWWNMTWLLQWTFGLYRAPPAAQNKLLISILILLVILVSFAPNVSKSLRASLVHASVLWQPRL